MNSGRRTSADIFNIFSIPHSVPRNEDDNSFEEQAECIFPAFGALQLQEERLAELCQALEHQTHDKISSTRNTPAIVLAEKMYKSWKEMLTSFRQLYSQSSLRCVLNLLKKDTSKSNSLAVYTTSGSSHEDKNSGTMILMEAGVKTGLMVIFTLLKQSWSQIAWQQGLFEALSRIPEVSVPLASLTPPSLSLPNEVLQSVLDVLSSMPPLSFSNPKAMSSFGTKCIKDCVEFLESVVNLTPSVDKEGRRLALQILFTVSLQYGSIMEILDWVDKVLAFVSQYYRSDPCATPLSLDVEFCQAMLKEIRIRTVSLYVCVCVCVYVCVCVI